MTENNQQEQAEIVNPFDVESIGLSPVDYISQVESQPEEVVEVVEPTPQPKPEAEFPTEVIASEPEIEEPPMPEFENEISKKIFESLESGSLESAASLLYEQAKLSKLSDISDEDKIKMKILYQNPEFSVEEVEDEYKSMFGIESDDDVDLDLMTSSEVAAHKKKVERETKRIERELKKASKEAESFLGSMRANISLPKLKPQKGGGAVNKEAVIDEWLEVEKNSRSKERQAYLESVEKNFSQHEGYPISYSDEEVQFNGKYTLTQDELSSLKEDLKDFTFEGFFEPRYAKPDGSLDVNKIADDLYLLKNFDKIIKSAVTQAVSNTKSSLVRGIKNIDYSDNGISRSTSPKSSFDSMVDVMFDL